METVGVLSFILLISINIIEGQKDKIINMPLMNSQDAALVAKIDMGPVNKQLKQYIDSNIKKEVQDTFITEVENMVIEKQTQLKDQMLKDYSGKINSTIEKYDNGISSVIQGFRSQFQGLVTNLSSQFETLSKNIDTRWDNWEEWRENITEQLANYTNGYTMGAVDGLLERRNRAIPRHTLSASDANYTGPPPVETIQDCKYNYKSGVYKIKPDGKTSMTVYCEATVDRGGWTVIQRRMDGSVNFYRTWVEYEKGFGNASGEFWLGNKNINILTSNGNYELRIDLEDWDGNTKYAKYTSFSVGDENSKYKLSIGGYSGSAGDGMNLHNNMKFSTKDQDNDAYRSIDCAEKASGGWWFKDCHHSNLNGLYKRGRVSSGYNVVSWQKWLGDRYSLKRTVMMIRLNN